MASTMTQLDAINKVLRAVGEPPVTSVDSQNPYVLSAKSILEGKSKEIQSVGWWFNTQYGVRLLPDAQGYVSVPSNTLSIDNHEMYGGVAVRDDHLIDLRNNTNKFTQSVTVDITEEVTYNNLPYVAAEYIAAEAAVEMQRSFEMDDKKLESLMIDAQNKMIEMRKQNMRNQNFNSMNTGIASRMVSTTLRTGTNPNIIGGG